MTVVALGVVAGSAAADRTEEAKVNLAQAVKRTVLVFPFDMPADASANKDEVSQLLTDTVISRLLASGQYTVIQFHKSLAPVARLRLDQQVTDADVAAPYAEDTSKATKISKLVGYEVAFIGAVDEYSYSQADNQATVVARGQLLDIKTGKSIGAPVILKGASSKGGSAKEPAKALEAARDAGSQIAQKLVPTISAPVTQPTNPITNKPVHENNGGKKRKSNNGLLFGLLAIGLGLGIGLASSGGGHGGGSGSGGNGDGPPSPP